MIQKISYAQLQQRVEERPAVTQSVSTLWIGGSLSWVEELCLSSFVNAGLRVQLYTYDAQMLAPRGVELCDARDILSEELVFENANRPGTFAGFSNIFRYRLLQIRETTWLDSDVLAGRNPLPGGSYLFGRESRRYINGAILRAPADSKFLQEMFDYSMSIDPNTIKWGQLGPKLVTQTAENLALAGLAQPRPTLYPVSYRQVWRLFDPQQVGWSTRQVEASSTIHLWNEVMRGHGIKSKNPPRGSFLWLYAQRIGYEFPSSEEISPDWVRRVWRQEINPRVFEKGFLEQRAGRLLRIAGLVKKAEETQPSS